MSIKKLFGSLLKFVAAVGGLSVLAAIVLVLIVWLAFMPKGNVSAYVNNIHMDKQNSAIKVFSDAQPIAFQMLGDWKYIIDLIGDPSVNQIRIADQKYRDSQSIKDALNINFSFQRETADWKIDVKFYATPILERFYSLVGKVDYDFVFFDFQPGEKGYWADVQIRPGEAGRRRLPKGEPKNGLALSRAIAEYVVASAASERRGWGNLFDECTGTFCPSDIPESSLGLSETRKGLRIMYLGPTSEVCVDNPTVECALRNAKESFQVATNDESNHVARLGLGLASLKLAHRLLDDGRSEYEVAEELDKAIVYLVQASKLDPNIASIIERKDFGNLLTKAEADSIDLHTEFLETATHYLEAKSGLKPALYDKVLQELNRIRNPPKYLIGHIDSIRITAELFKAKTLQEAEPHLEALGRPEMRDAMRPWLWNYIYGYFLCYWNDNDPERVTKAQSHFKEAENNLPTGNEHSLLQLKTAQAYCAARTNHNEFARAEIDSYFDPLIARLKVRKDLGELEGEELTLLSSALLAKAEVLVALKSYKEAEVAIHETLENDPEWESFFQRSPIFAEYRDEVRREVRPAR